MRRVGVHTSIAGGLQRSLERARNLGCDTLQIFSHNPRGWSLRERSPQESTAFRSLREKYDISPVFIHCSYLINLAARDGLLQRKSVEMVAEELTIADAIGADYVVLHTGSGGNDIADEARKRASACLKDIAGKGRWRSAILLENTAGERGDIASRVWEMASIIEKVPAGLVAGICIDTCHAFSAGYDVASYEGLDLLSDEIEKYIGRRVVKLVHLNDSKGGLGCGLDRHEHIGAGKIGISGFKIFLSHPFFSDIPLILETPKKSDEDDPRNITTVKGLLGQRSDTCDPSPGDRERF